MSLEFFWKGLWEIFKAPLLVLTAPALPLFLICLGTILGMVLREFRKNK